MYKIIQALIDAISNENMIVLAIILISIVVMFGCNIYLGTMQGKKKEGFSWGKFLFGIEKAFGICAVTMALCFAFNLLCIGLTMAEFLDIGTPVIAGTEIVAVASVYGLDLAREVLEKMKASRELKYLSYDDIKVQQNPQSEKGIG